MKRKRGKDETKILEHAFVLLNARLFVWFTFCDMRKEIEKIITRMTEEHEVTNHYAIKQTASKIKDLFAKKHLTASESTNDSKDMLEHREKLINLLTDCGLTNFDKLVNKILNIFQSVSTESEPDDNAVAKRLHEEANKLETDGIVEMIKQDIYRAHIKLDTARALRISANHLNGVNAG